MGFLTSLINRSPFYNSLRYSRLSDLIVESLTGKTRKNRAYYQQWAPADAWKGQLVFDVGANKGNKTRAFLDLGARVVCIEPEKKALETLHYRFGSHPRVTIEPKGVSDKPGEMRLFVKDYRSGYNTLSDKWQNQGKAFDTPIDSYPVTVTTLEELIRVHGHPFFIKIDVEGFELPVIQGLKEPVPFLSFEANLPEFRRETRQILAHLSRLYSGRAKVRLFIEEKSVGEWMDLDAAVQEIDRWNRHGLELLVSSKD